MSDYGVVIDTATVRMERTLSGSVDQVWAYLTDSEKRSTWLASGIMELKVGGQVTLAFDFKCLTKEITPERFRPYETGHVQSGHVTQCEPPHLLCFTWNEKNGQGSEVRFELKPQGKKTLLTLTHSKLPNRKEMVNVSGGWHTHLDVLEDRLSEQEPRLFWNTFLQMEKEYQASIPEYPAANA
ncbi:SRPBCC family protein [Herminiimonas fonticola]|uniref:Uncharacterized protein YndB with AHSA1/START domain n=1 Tax=Herminiimonas fonticola TaxID=303380 RepID=A0A4R6G703_9BURK|nr:SRPBCC family protein [Herminiimonas fonticola]RBA24295.1 Activator of Hsp90 ATPase 1-like protein [Herminiimonas fonticola]TDN90296.1 uncharacterized protein YndB with AHSA1/START domain [Herminiimonas fonticola]